MHKVDLALLLTLKAKPRRELQAAEKEPVIALLKAGYVTYGPYGWIATVQGCSLLDPRDAGKPGQRSAPP